MAAEVFDLKHSAIHVPQSCCIVMTLFRGLHVTVRPHLKSAIFGASSPSLRYADCRHREDSAPILCSSSARRQKPVTAARRNLGALPPATLAARRDKYAPVAQLDVLERT